jgi:hypothetical protein
VPGLVVNPAQGVVFYSRAMGSATRTASPQVMINDVPMAGEAGYILESIDYNVIESIEFTKRLNALYGSQGTYGIISVYTKTGMSFDETAPNFQTIKLPGYSPTRKFLFPDYEQPREDNSQPDYRSTIYWNPDVRIAAETGKASVTFFASDLGGLYRVVVEGVTAEGQPLRAVKYLTITER